MRCLSGARLEARGRRPAALAANRCRLLAELVPTDRSCAGLVCVGRQLHSNRPPIPDVPAIYFISPTAANVRRVALDAQQGLYDSIHLNFTSALPRPLMEDLAGQLAASGSGDLVEQVWDQYLDFIVPSPSLFSLLPRPVPASSSSAGSAAPPTEPSANLLRPTYALLNDPSTTEELLSSEVDRIAAGLFSVLATTGQIPLVRCPRGNAAEMVGRKLDSLLRDHLQTSARTGGPAGGLFSGGDLGGLQRPCSFKLPGASPARAR